MEPLPPRPWGAIEESNERSATAALSAANAARSSTFLEREIEPGTVLHAVTAYGHVTPRVRRILLLATSRRAAQKFFLAQLNILTVTPPLQLPRPSTGASRRLQGGPTTGASRRRISSNGLRGFPQVRRPAHRGAKMRFPRSARRNKNLTNSMSFRRGTRHSTKNARCSAA